MDVESGGMDVGCGGMDVEGVGMSFGTSSTSRTAGSLVLKGVSLALPRRRCQLVSGSRYKFYEFMYFTNLFFNVLPGFGVKRLEDISVALSFSSSQGSGGAARRERQRGERRFPPRRGVEALMEVMGGMALRFPPRRGVKALIGGDSVAKEEWRR